MPQMQRVLSLIYPDQCLACDAQVTHSGALCGECWSNTPFIDGLVCDACGVPLPGSNDGEAAFCDDCLAQPRPWEQGRAALSYSNIGRRIVLALKHGDRTEFATAAAPWLFRAATPLLKHDTVLVPIPVHWTRLISRRYNQAAELSRALAHHAGLPHCPDALVRTKRTRKLDGLTVDQRFATLNDAIQPNPRRSNELKGRNVCLVDDVMTSGATLACATNAAFAAGADRVSVIVLARVEKAP
ncbi:MAG: ComF family protein [Pseudomonadota bacterium]